MPSETIDDLDGASLRDLHAFVLELGRSLALAGAAVSETQERLTAVVADISGFFGALAMTPIAPLLARLPGGPRSQVTFLPAFWLLVPGALASSASPRSSVTPRPRASPISSRPVGSIVSIALGVLGGVSLYRALAETPAQLRR